MKDARERTPTVSVVMSVYNGERYLRQAVDSILNQTYRDLEFIVINDGSTDETAAILASYDDPRLRVFSQENAGLTVSLNRGIARARGQYVARMDADDVSDPTRLRRQIAFLEATPEIALVGCWIHVINRRGRRVGLIEKPTGAAAIKAALEVDNCISHGSAVFRTEAARAIGGYDETHRTAQDYDFFARLAERYALANLPETLYSWREHPQSITHQFGKSQEHFVQASKRKRASTPGREGDGPDSPDFSVLMANYNNARYVAEAIESVLAQSYRNWELVVIDDRSTDKSIDIIEPYRIDPRVRLIQNDQNLGYIATTRLLIREARSNLVGILDSDDTLDHTAIEKVLAAYAANPEAGMIYTQFWQCDASLRPELLGFSAKIPEGKSTLQCDCVSAFRTFKRDVYYRTTGLADEILYAEDKDLYFKLEEVTRLLFIDEPLYNWRMLPNSQSTHPVRGQQGRVSFTLARHDAYRRRQGTAIPNLTRGQMIRLLADALLRSVKVRDPRALHVLKRLVLEVTVGQRS